MNFKVDSNDARTSASVGDRPTAGGGWPITAATLGLQSARVSWRSLSLVLIVLAGCGAAYEAEGPPQNDPARQDPARGVDPTPGAGDIGVVTGRVEVAQSFAPAAPVSFEKVMLYREDSPVTQTTTDAHGGFMFVGLKPGGLYEARVEGNGHVGRVRFSLRVAGHLSGLRLVVLDTVPK